MPDGRKKSQWVILAILSLIWGTSYILMKKGLESFSSFQIASLRMCISSLVLLPLALKNLHKINRKNIFSIFIIGILGNGIPSFLYPLAQTRINSSLTGMLNSLSPVFTLVIGIVLYKRSTRKSQIAGVFLGMIGAAGLLYKGNFSFNGYGLFVVLATVLNGFSSNEVSRVKELNGIEITSLAFLMLLPFAFGSLIISGFSYIPADPNWGRNLCFIVILAVIGTSFAQTIYYRLILDSSPVFASTVTYFIPIVATAWGAADNEHFTSSMFVSVFFIFAGVYIINRSDFLKIKTNRNK